ncbi:MAG: hypothetical protein ABI551_04215 [Polyangiaceae bacterium]
MLREERATKAVYDAAKDTLVLEIGGGQTAGGSAAPTELNVLVDAGGHLVGIDLGREPSRFVVMVGRHEDVAEQRAARGEVVFANGVPSVVTLFAASKVVRTDERNPRL